ncbi:MAG TPA: carbon-nitrogen hydrolase family protein [Acidimicrobiales bacterium]|jgi:predicted amidohydrolase|nr:carbon-nitrogen hydrolase family protein [Acidimicrobiales bacterium]
MRVALCQFAVGPDPAENAQTIVDFSTAAAAQGADMLVAPESCLKRFLDPSEKTNYAEELDGEFVSALAKASSNSNIVIVAGTKVPAPEGRSFNTLVAVANGEVLAAYYKLHLYDAFGLKESDTTERGTSGVVTIDVAGVRFGLSLCYDVRFPELYRALVDEGAQALLVPAAWVSGPVKEEHWLTLLRARAIENTCYVVAPGETGVPSIGRSVAFDPLGLQLADLGYGKGMTVVDVNPERVAEVRKVLPSLEHRRFGVVPRF